MKKFLSLVLALAMAMSLVVINTSAAEYTDDQDITYSEAVDVISEIGIVDGYTDGSFNPTNGLTRGAAAKIICNLILGPTTAAELHATTAPFSDVSTSNEFAGYIAYCSQQGIISGYADGTFRPANPLTGYAFMKMLLGALGYDQYTEGYVGDNWSIAVAKQAIGIGLNNGLTEDFDGTDYVTREEACLYALNTLQADLVEYDTVITTTINGETVTIGNSIPHSQTWGSSATRRDNIKQDNYIQFAEEYFNRLVKAEDADEFMRPAYTWTYAGTEIGTYVDWTQMVEEYTTKVEGSDLYSLLTTSTIRDYDLYYYVDGASVNMDKDDIYRTSNVKMGQSGNGVLTQVFVDDDDKEIVITSINTYLARATSDYNSTRETVTLEVYYGGSGTTTLSYPVTVDVDDVPAIADLHEDDYVLVNGAGDTTAVSNKDVVAVSDPEVMTDVTVTRFSKTSEDSSAGQAVDRVTKLTTGGTEYSNNEKAYYDYTTLGDYDNNLLTNKTYTVYLDQYGYFIGVELYSGDDQYVFISSFDKNSSALSNRNADALAVFTDGTMAQIKVNVTDTDTNITNAGDSNYDTWSTSRVDNRWYTYTVNNDVYTLDPVDHYTNRVIPTVAGATGETIQTDRLSLTDRGGNAGSVASAPNTYSFGNDDSVYITVDMEGVAPYGDVVDEITGVYTGVQSVRLNIPTNQWISAVYDSDYYVVAAIVWGEAEGAVDNYAYILSGAYAEEYDDAEDYYYWDFDAVVNGEIQTMTIKSKYANTVTQLRENAVQELVLDADGYVTRINTLTDPDVTTEYSDSYYGGFYVAGTSGVDQVYTNTDLSSGTSTTVSDYDAYHIAVRGTAATSTMYLTGRTLHFGGVIDQTGLAIGSDAKAVVRQQVNGSWQDTEYASVREAYSVLADTDTTTAGLQFYGNVAAVLDSNGVAQWVVFYDLEPVSSGNLPNYGNNSGIGNVKGMNGVISVATGSGNAIVRAEVLAQVDGVYQVDGDVPDGLGASGLQDEDVIYFKVTNTDVAANYILNIRNAAGQLVYTETYGPVSAGPVLCYVNLAAGTNGLGNAGNGSLTTTDIAAGTYSYTFSCGNSSISGTFTINA